MKVSDLLVSEKRIWHPDLNDNGHYLKRDCKRNFEETSMQIWHYPIHIATLLIFVWSKMNEISMFMILQTKNLQLWFLYKTTGWHIVIIRIKHFEQRKTTISSILLIRLRFQGYRCVILGIAIFIWRFTWNYAYSPWAVFYSVSLILIQQFIKKSIIK